MYETALNYRDLFLVLSSELKTLKQYFGNEPKYREILTVFTDYNKDEDNPIPKQKDLLAQLGLTRTSLMKLLQALYHDFQHSIFQAHRYSIKKTEYYVSAETLDDHRMQIGLDHMEHIPRRGDVFMIPFIKTEYSSGYFRVKEVNHTVENQVHTISIFVSAKRDDDESSRFYRQ